MRNYTQEGKTVAWTNGTGSDVVSGQVVAFGDARVGIATVDIADTETGSVALMGVYRSTKPTGGGTAFAQGGKVWFDLTTSMAYNAAGTGRVFGGHAHLAATDAQAYFQVALAPASGESGGLVAGLATGFPLPVEKWRQGTEPNRPVATSSPAWRVELDQARIWDAPSTPVGAAGGAPSADDLGLNDGTWLTAAPRLSTQDVKTLGALTEYALLQVRVPLDYEAGTPLTLRINAGMATTVADTSATADLEVVRAADPGTDICATAAQSINTLVAADYDYTLTAANVVPGELLTIRVILAVNDGAGGAAVLAQVYSAAIVPSNADLLLVDNGHGTANPTLETGDVKALGAVTRTTRVQYRVPDNYVAGQAATLRLNAEMNTTISDGTATIDAEVTRAAAPGTDICATAAQSINDLAADDYDFTLTPTDLVPGDVLDILVTVAVNDAATGTAVIGQLNVADSAVLLDVAA